MIREILEIVMLFSLLGGLFFVKNEFAKDKQQRIKAADAEHGDTRNL